MKITFKTEPPQIDAYFELFESTGWNEEYHLSKDELLFSISNSYYTLSAYDNDRLIGFGRIVSDGILHAMIYEMIINPDYQGKGIGGDILNMLIQKCLDSNIRDIQLFCAKGKRGFYEKYNFVARPDDGPVMDYKRTNGWDSFLCFKKLS